MSTLDDETQNQEKGWFFVATKQQKTSPVMIKHYSSKVEKIFQLAPQKVGTRWYLVRQKK